MIKIYIFVILIIFNLGCAGHQATQSLPKENSNHITFPAIKSSSYISARRWGRTIKEECPFNSTSWRQEHTEKLLSYASRCVQLKNWSRLEEIANHLAQKEVLSPWGPYFLSLASENSLSFSRSLWMIELAIKRSPATGFLYYQKGRVYWSMGDFHLAVKSFEEALKYDAQLADAHLVLAQIYFRDGDFKKSKNYFYSLLNLEADNIIAVSSLAEIYLKDKNFTKSVNYLEQAISLSPNDLTYRLRLARVYETQLKDWSKALSVYKKAKAIALQSRGLAQDLGIDLDQKINSIESMLVKEAPGEKISRSELVKERAK